MACPRKGFYALFHRAMFDHCDAATSSPPWEGTVVRVSEGRCEKAPLTPDSLPRSSEHPGLALVLESALAVDVDDGRVVEDAIEHRHGEYAIARERALPAAEGQIGSQDHRTALITLRHDLEQQLGLLPAHQKVAERDAR